MKKRLKLHFWSFILGYFLAIGLKSVIDKDIAFWALTAAWVLTAMFYIRFDSSIKLDDEES